MVPLLLISAASPSHSVGSLSRSNLLPGGLCVTKVGGQWPGRTTLWCWCGLVLGRSSPCLCTSFSGRHGFSDYGSEKRICREDGSRTFDDRWFILSQDARVGAAVF